MKKIMLYAASSMMVLICLAAYGAKAQSVPDSGTILDSERTPVSVSASDEKTIADAIQTNAEPDSEPVIPISYEEYERFGLKYDQSKNELYYGGEPVRYFYDGVVLFDGAEIIRCEFLNENGTVDVHTTWLPTENGDGSIEPFSSLTGLERYSQEEFDKRDFSDFYGTSAPVTCVSENWDPTAESFSDRFEKYKKFGIEYIESETACGAGTVYYNGQPAAAFIDILPDGGIFSFHSAAGGEFNVKTVYDRDGNLAGIETTD